MQNIKKYFKKLFVAAIFVVTISIISVSAATFTVTNSNDSGTGSLREALSQANSNGQDDTINFDAAFFNQPRTITLTTGELLITRDGTVGNGVPGRLLTINGPGANLLTISGNSASRVFYVSSHGNLVMSGLTVRDGNGVGTEFNNFGGGMLATNAYISLSNVTFRNNSVTDSGGAIYFHATSTFSMTDSLVTENFAAEVGGGIFAPISNTSTVTIRSTTISNNSADRRIGGLGVANGTVTIENSLITGNRAGLTTAGSQAGGLSLFFTPATITDTTISNNTAGNPGIGGIWGGVHAESTSNNPIVFRRVTVSGNKSYTCCGNGGGGMYLRPAVGNGAITVIDSTVSDNEAVSADGINNIVQGGGIYIAVSSGRTNVINTTIANNQARATGGGIYNLSTDLMVINSTITGNTALSSGGGIFNVDSVGGVSNIQNTIIANNTGNTEPDVVGTFTSNGYNVVGNTAGSTGFGAAGDQLNVNPLLDPNGLQDNGGTTSTIALLAGSPAINAGNNVLAVNENGNPLAFDQRGACFRRIVGGTVDIGAFESGAAALCNTLFDFDGDGKTDLSIFRPSAGEWWYLRSSDGGNRAFQFGVSSDKIVPADYTGDGKTDIAIWRPSTGEWFVLRSEDNSFYSFPFGASGDIPTPADFDGDGLADPAVFRPSTGNWFIIRSSDGGTTITTFGGAGDLPVAADYDGDGKADVAIFRPSDGSWWLGRSSAGLIVTNFGTSTDKTVPADYTGDGKADVAIFRPSTGEWFILRSEDFSFYSVPFGANGDIPAPGDYDGDGIADVAIFRPSTATWYISGSTSGTQIAGFGATGDQPVPSAFVR